MAKPKKYRVTSVKPIPKIDHAGKTTGYVYQAYISNGSQTLVVGPYDTMGEAKRAGAESARMHNQ